MASTTEPSIMSPMTFQHEALEKGSIRLIRILSNSEDVDIRCTIEHRKEYAIQKDDEDAYVALSYCWGTSISGKCITLNGLPLAITDNLWEALRAICRYHDATAPFWIDAICIDQANVTERNEQVAQMRQIFSKAGRTYAWLGLEDTQTRLAFKGLRKVHRDCCEVESKENHTDILLRYGCLCQRPPHEHDFLTARGTAAVLALGHREYFRRVWIQPEYLQPTIYTLSILCGSHSIDAITFNHALMCTPPPSRPHALPSHLGELLFQRNASSYNECWPHSSPPYKFRHVLDLFSRCGCADARDRIFVMLGDPGLQLVCTPGDQLGPDYRWSVDELALVVLAFYDTLLLHPQYCPNLVVRDKLRPLQQGRVFNELDRLLAHLHPALGVPRSLVGVRQWFDGHAEWTACLAASGSVRLGTGRVVQCSGPTLNLILNEREYVGSAQWLGPDVIKIGMGKDRRYTVTGTIE